MTKAVRGRILKDANGDISDHLRNHIHLTNCIHLKNHMHRQSPILPERSILRDLVALQRSRSLRDPSASPTSWHSPSIVELLSKKGDREGRKSAGKEQRREGRRKNRRSPPSFGSSELVPNNVLGVDIVIPDTSDLSCKGADHGGRVFKVGSSGQGDIVDVEDDEEDEDDLELAQEVDNDERHSKQQEKQNQVVRGKTLSEQLDVDSDKASSNNLRKGWKYQLENSAREGTSTRGHGATRWGKRRKFRSSRRPRPVPVSKYVAGENEISVASNSVGRVSTQKRAQMEEDEEGCVDQNMTTGPPNVCGIPWNWSRIHDRGKTFLDKAGRSLSCGLSESKLRKGSNEKHFLEVASDHSSSSSKPNLEALPLLVDEYATNGTSENGSWVHDYSGELGIYADRLLKNGMDSDLASEIRSGNQGKLRRHHKSRHQSLTQKYMPRTFRDLVGQNLVVQALSNTVMKKKVGLLYVFYGSPGTGKTSCARVFARALNCQSLDDIGPCGYCNSCVSHEKGKSRSIKEVGPVGKFDFKNMMDLLDNILNTQLPSQYRVLIFDECDSLSPDCWSAISKVIDRAPRRVVFVLVCSSLEVLPHIIISRCQKFFFPKLKDADVIYTLQWISSRENIDIDKDALKLVASRSDGSLRDAEMTLEQLSLLGQKISLPLVQELVGLVSDEKLVHLLDLALSADTVNTVKDLRAIMETGVEPIALMSQIATVITDILAGSYDFSNERTRRKFFRRQSLSKDDMEKLRRALKTLSEAEKQLRTCNDKLTWLTAALLQLAPDHNYPLDESSTEASFVQSSLARNSLGGRETANRNVLGHVISNDGREMATKGPNSLKNDRHQASKNRHYEEIWLEVLQQIHSSSLRNFLYQEGRLVYVSFGAAATVQLLFSSQVNKMKAEKLTSLMLQAFESVLGSPVTIEIRCASNRDSKPWHHVLQFPVPAIGVQNAPESNKRCHDVGGSEIVELPYAQRLNAEEFGRSQQRLDEGPHQEPNEGSSIVERSKANESLVRGKISLAHVIQQAEVQQAGWSKSKAVSIAEKLEQENLRLEPRSRGLLCWTTSKGCLPKRAHWRSRSRSRHRSRSRSRSRRPHSFLKLVSCGKCITSRSRR